MGKRPSNPVLPKLAASATFGGLFFIGFLAS